MIRRSERTGDGPWPSDIVDLDRELRGIAIDERCSFGQELRAELVEENNRIEALGGVRSFRPRPRWLAAAVLLLVAGTLTVPPLRASLARFLGALSEPAEMSATPAAATPSTPDQTPATLDGLSASSEQMSAEPLVPATLPALLDPSGARRILADEYPGFLQEVGIGGAVRVLVWVRPDGATDNPQVGTSSGITQLDMAALRAARLLRFLPATRGGEAVGTWVEFSIRFWPNPMENQPDPHSQVLQIPLSN